MSWLLPKIALPPVTAARCVGEFTPEKRWYYSPKGRAYYARSKPKILARLRARFKNDPKRRAYLAAKKREYRRRARMAK